MVKVGSYFQYQGIFKPYVVEVKAVGKIDEIWVDDCFSVEKDGLTNEERYNSIWVRFCEAKDGEVFDQYAIIEDFMNKAVPCEEPESRKRARLGKEDPGLIQDCRCGGAGACMECNPRLFYNGPISR